MKKFTIMMKKLFGILFLLISFSATAQNNLTKDSLYKAIRLMKRVNDATDYNPIIQKFDKIALVDQKDWIPLYYGALSRTFMVARNDFKNQNDIYSLLDESIQMLNKAFPLNKNEEILILKAYCNILKMKNDYKEGYSKYGNEINNLLTDARALNGSNPRLLLMEGINLYYQPEEISGGKVGAINSLQVALDIFKDGEIEKYMFMPTWGHKITEDLLQ